tara:strand:+ start:7881 stop:8213 length:333 start_codon:yes stop_codon:yes gene_type:complete
MIRKSDDLKTSVELLKQDNINMRQMFSSQLESIRKEVKDGFAYLKEDIHNSIKSTEDKITHHETRLNNMKKAVSQNTEFRNKTIGALVVIGSIGIANIVGSVLLFLKLLI